ncbi:hypothetical protein P5673_032742 [Acropora cervicornis]|uniref:Uncharacterized protein n=1 Tax=Acropora cervicornis TaxID=6130 RepID=A0AAD9URN2_ACRCE|nr:hypothetical protein P5673_032742 [Acropora cervicornis]
MAPVNNLSQIIEYYNNALRQVLDKNAPQKSKNRSNQKELFRTDSKLRDLPPDELPDKFASFFIQKISAIHSNLSEFDPVSELDVEQLIKFLSSKACVSHPLLTWMTKQYLPLIDLATRGRHYSSLNHTYRIVVKL